MSRSSHCLLLCFLLAAILGGAASTTTAAGTKSTEPADPAQTYAAVDSYLREQLETLGIPGAAVAVVRNGTQCTRPPSAKPTTPGGR
jgi:CubicO group peptidase (beta-lactamase class C family)